MAIHTLREKNNTKKPTAHFVLAPGRRSFASRSKVAVLTCSLVAFVFVPLLQLNYTSDAVRMLSQDAATEQESQLDDQELLKLDQEYFAQHDFRILSIGGDDNDDDDWGNNKKLKIDRFKHLPNDEYPALCTYSMLGNDTIYDVILIDYHQPSTISSLMRVGKRLRQRFPDAVILYVPPTRDEENKVLRGNHDTAYWLRKMVNDSSIQGRVLEKEYSTGSNKGGASWYDMVVEAIQKKFVADTQDDHESSSSSVWIPQQTMKLLRQLQHKRGDNTQPWQQMDKCANFWSPDLQRVPHKVGRTNLRPNFSHQKNGDLCQQPPCVQFVLETHYPQLNTMELVNDIINEDQAHLYLLHNTPSSQKKKNQKTQVVTVKFKNGKLQATVDNTNTNDNSMTYVGLVPKGESLMALKPVDEKDTNDKKPFQLTGFILTPEKL